VALLRALFELRGELGSVLAVVHFNHKIRPESGAEAEFVERLAQELGLEFLGGEGDAKKFASQQRMSLETAARELRYEFFSQLSFDKIATAHTLDDQAETVLMKLLRGAGTKGLSGIWPVRQYPVPSTQYPENAGPSTRAKDGRSLGITSVEIIRPMLGVRRKEVEGFLRGLGQQWCEDASNRDVKHTRNKVRHELLPLLEREYNPNIYQQLADAAEVARAEEEYWAEVVRRQEAGGGRQEKQHSAIRNQRLEKQVPRSARDDNYLELNPLLEQPIAVQRRVVRRAFARVSGKALDFEHTDELVRFLERRESSLLQLPAPWFAVLDWPQRTLSFEERGPVRNAGTSKPQSASKSVSKKKEPLAGRKV